MRGRALVGAFTALLLLCGCDRFHYAFITDDQGRALILHGLNVTGSAKFEPQRMP